MRPLVLSLIAIISFSIAQEKFDLDATMPVDEKVITGTLENGLIYYIRKNGEPQKRAEVRLVVKTGSIQEDDDQLGLAHFVEHMAFNGTKNFPKQHLVDFLEKSGMRFGADVNAYTSFDETVYQLQLPTDSIKIFTTGFQVLEDWAHNVLFDPEEVEKERGVVIEEWRSGRGANQRIRDKQYPKLFYKSKYADRLPIGTKEILNGFEHQTLKRFYKDWYRPDLMALVAVGDFDVEMVESLIHEHFNNLQNPVDERPLEKNTVPDHDQLLYAINSDPELRFSSVSLYTKIDVKEHEKVGDYRQALVTDLYTSMLNQRLAELVQKEDPPFLYAQTAEFSFIVTRGFYVMDAVVNENNIEKGLDAILTEAERVKRFGFTESELEREKKSTLRSIEQALREYDKQKSVNFAEEYIRAFLEGEPFPGLEFEAELYNKFIPEITLEEVNAIGQKWVKDESRVVTVSIPEKEGVLLPKEEELNKVLTEFNKKIIEPYKEDKLDLPIVTFSGSGSKVATEKKYPKIDVTEWTLANGVKVILKPTDFKNDQILFSAFSYGGQSLIKTDNLIQAKTADALAVNSGVGNYNLINLEKYLADKVVSVSPSISTIDEGFTGSASPQDLEQLLQMVYAYFTAPRFESDAYSAFLKRMEAILQNRDSNPNTAFNDTLTALLTQNDPRSKPMVLNDLAKMDLSGSAMIFKERFADGNDFVFLFTGNFKTDSIQPLIEKYLGGLPVLATEENWQDVNKDYPTGVHNRDVFKGLEEKSRTSIMYTGPFEWNIKNRFIASALVDVINIKLREKIREDKSGTYGVSVRGTFNHYPKSRYRISIGFGSDPQRVVELKNEIYTQIDSIVNYGTTQDYLDKVKETSTREYETNLRENSYWLNQLELAYFNKIEPEFILDTPQLIKALTLEDIHNAARQLLHKDNYIEVVLYPEGWNKK